MKDELTESQANAVLKALDDALAEGPWEASNFLRLIGKNLKEIRENFVNEMSKGSVLTLGNAIDLATLPVKKANQQEIFISLYSSEGSQLSSWEKILASLPRQAITRPIYDDEQQVIQLIKTKENKVNEAYVSLYVNTSDILTLPREKQVIDKLGNPIVSLKDRAIDLLNIVRFVHVSHVYRYTKGRLIMM